MSTSQPLKRACNLILQEAFTRELSSLHLVPRKDSYVVTFHKGQEQEEVMTPPPHHGLGIFVHFCQRAGVAKDVCEGQFSFPVDGQERIVDLKVVNTAEGKGAQLTFS